MLQPSLKKNDSRAKLLIGIFSFVVFAVVVSLGKIQLKVDLGFNVHVFATINAFINSVIAVLLVLALIAVKNKNFLLHKRMMMSALLLSILFLVSYIAHHLFAGETKFGGEGVFVFQNDSMVSKVKPVFQFGSSAYATGPRIPRHRFEGSIVGGG